MDIYGLKPYFSNRLYVPEYIIQKYIEHTQERNPATIVDYAMLMLSIKANIKATGEMAQQINPILIQHQPNDFHTYYKKKWNRKIRQEKETWKMVKLKTFSKWLFAESKDYMNMIKATKSKHENKEVNQKGPTR